jgi:hypothetical protein
MEKKPYEAPTIKKVRLEVKNSVLADCHTSPTMSAATTFPCSVTGCYTTSG